MSADRKFKRELFELYFEQTWLERHEQKVEDLLSLAENGEQRSFVIELLKRFNYINENRLELLLGAMADRICHEIGAEQTKTQIVTTVIDNEPDSSQFLLQMLKNRLTGSGFPEFKKRSRGHEAVKYSIERPNIIMVDEFSGTGNTVISRVEDLRARILGKYRSAGLDQVPRIIVCLLAAMRSAHAKIRDAGIEVYVEFEMPAAISETFDPAMVPKKVAWMENIEARLDQNRMDPFPSLGYGRAESLFYVQNSNPPNSNFPILWWKHLSNGSALVPLLERDEPHYAY